MEMRRKFFLSIWSVVKYFSISVFSLLLLAVILENYKSHLSYSKSLLSEYYIPLEQSAADYFNERAKYERNCLSTLSNLGKIKDEIRKYKNENVEIGKSAIDVQDFLLLDWRSNFDANKAIEGEIARSWGDLVKYADELSIACDLSSEYKVIAKKRDSELSKLRSELALKAVAVMKESGMESYSDIVDLYHDLKKTGDRSYMSREQAYTLVAGLADSAISMWECNLQSVRKQTKLDVEFYNNLNTLFFPRVREAHREGFLSQALSLLR